MPYNLSKNIKPDPIKPPCKKKIYYSQDEANEMAVHIRETRSIREINVYRCTVCGFWHLTSKV
jgi:hypothetical protein